MSALSPSGPRRPDAVAIGALLLAIGAAHWLALAGFGVGHTPQAAMRRTPVEVPARSILVVAPTRAPAAAMAAPARTVRPERASASSSRRVSPRVPPVEAVTRAPDSAAAEPWPTYATDPPPAFSARYVVLRGAASGRGVLHWQPSSDGYVARFDAELGAHSWAWESRGSYDAAGLAPLRFTDRRARRGTQAANFQRGDDGGSPRIGYSGPPVEHPLPPGAQDRLSWIVQLAAIARARAEPWTGGEAVSLYVSGARGDADRWDFVVAGLDDVALPGGTQHRAVRLLREPRRRYDVRIEVWLDALRGHLPLRLRTTPTGDAPVLEWLLDDDEVPAR
jgi:hypothetical protein